MPGLFIPGILCVHMAAVMLGVIGTFNFLKAEIWLRRILPAFASGVTTVAVPVHVSFSTLRINVFAVFHIEPAVIVPGIIGAVFAGASVVPCQFQMQFLHFLKIFWRKKGQRSC